MLTYLKPTHIRHYLKEWTQGDQVLNSHAVIPGARSKGLLAKRECRQQQKSWGK